MPENPKAVKLPSNHSRSPVASSTLSQPHEPSGCCLLSRSCTILFTPLDAQLRLPSSSLISAAIPRTKEAVQEPVIKRLYVHNYRCLENFDFLIGDSASVLLIGKNGAGKTTVSLALEILQRIARGVNRVGELVQPKDLARGREDVPMRFELEAEIKGGLYHYQIAFDLPKDSRELRVIEERLSISGDPVFSREELRLDWHLAALPILQERAQTDPLFIFRQWLSRMLILRPIPILITGDSDSETLTPKASGEDFGAWFSGILAHSPSSYGKIDAYLKRLLPDLRDIKNPSVGKDARSLEVQFATSLGSATLPFADLSDGEKCFIICAMVLAADEIYGPLTCFWDEPDNYLALSEVGHFIIALRKGFQSGGQFIATSHNPEAIRRFSYENTHLLFRANHLEPSKIRTVKDLDFKGDLIPALVRGDLEP